MSINKRYIGVIWFVWFVLSGCSDDEKRTKPRAGETSAKGRSPAPFLNVIPASTPFLYISFEPLPKEILRQFSDTAKSLSDGQVAALAAQLDTDVPSISDAERFAMAFVLEASKSRDGLGFGSLGAGESPKLAIYGIGLSPVVRVKLSEPDRGVRFIKQVLRRAGIEPKSQVAPNTNTLWIHKGSRMSHVLGLTGDDLVFSAHPHSVHEQVMAHIRGEGPRQPSLESKGTVQQMMKDRKLSGMGLGFIDVDALWKGYLGIGPEALMTSWRAFGLKQAARSTQCQDEGSRLAGAFRRIEFGSRLDDGNRFTGFIFVDSDEKFVHALETLMTPLPPIDIQKDTLFSLGIGFKFGEAIRLLLDVLSTMKPFTCSDFVFMNQKINDLRADWAARIAMIPPVLKTITGGYVELVQLNLEQKVGADAKGTTVIFGQRMDAVYELVKTIMPGLVSAEIKADGQTRPVDVSKGLPLATPVAVNLTSSKLGLAIGAGHSHRLDSILDEKKQGPPRLITLSYDVGRFSNAMQTIVERIAAFKGLSKNVRPKSLPAALGQFTLDVYPRHKELVIRTAVQLLNRPNGL
ncbi:MAG: hypothetical protein VYA30_02055 [Myxococcota bacterium]|nr:hypothetical protein [Myxococcota bacterium]